MRQVLLSRPGRSVPYLCTELAHAVRCESAVLDGEIACSRIGRAKSCRWPVDRKELQRIKREVETLATMLTSGGGDLRR
jgi:hypothetical protein